MNFNDIKRLVQSPTFRDANGKAAIHVLAIIK